ncbi:TPA: hypothetical protein ACH3X2_011041 [Trebouxia sp. C0005]
MTAFAFYTDASCLEHFPAVHLTRFSLTQALTCGVKTVIGTNRGSSPMVSAVVPETHSILPDGRLKVGINLPLLARRFRYLRLIGEGTSAQVILAEDTHRHKRELVVIKVLKRHFAAAGHKELRALRFLHTREAAWQSGLVRLQSGFTHCGHVCLVLERLHGSLLDYVVHSARLHRSEALHNLKKIATQLLVGHPTQLMSKNVTAHESALLVLHSVQRVSQTRHTYHVGGSCPSYKPRPRDQEGHVAHINCCEPDCHHGKQRKHWQRAHALRWLVSVELGERRHQAHSKRHDHCLPIYSTALQKRSTRRYNSLHTMTTRPTSVACHSTANQADSLLARMYNSKRLPIASSKDSLCGYMKTSMLYQSVAVVQVWGCLYKSTATAIRVLVPEVIEDCLAMLHVSIHG